MTDTSNASSNAIIWEAPPAGAKRGRKGTEVEGFLTALREAPAGTWARLPGEFSSLPKACKDATDVEWQLTRDDVQLDGGKIKYRVKVYGRIPA